jgi:tRNA (cytidine/uridine-2'-O-)-methyltransferase
MAQRQEASADPVFHQRRPLYLDHRYTDGDILLFGRESAGVPDEVAAAADARLVIPIEPGLRSLNVAMAAAMALGEALRQTGSRDNGMRAQ